MAAKQSNIELIRQLCCRRTLISTEVCEPVSVDLPAYIELRACSFMVNKLCRASPRRKGYQRAFPTSHGHAAFRDLGANVIGIRTQYKSLETRSSMHYMTINNVQTVNSNN